MRSATSSRRVARAVRCSARRSRPRASIALSTTVTSISPGEAMKRRVAILISGRGSNMAALLKAAAEPDFPAEIAIVVSNRADAAGLEKARAAGAPAVVVESKRFGKDRAAFETALQAVLDSRGVELI